MSWDDETCILLIGLYREKPMLWDPNHENYSNEQEIENAWTEISRQISCTAEDAKNTMMSLLEKYTKEKTKYLRSCRLGSGYTYMSQWYAYDYFSFFPDNHEMKCLQTKKKTEENCKDADITWDNETCLSLIASYERQRTLWDKRHEHYHYKPAKDAAWEEISGEFECSVDLLKKKMASLTGSYRREKSRLKRSSALGKSYMISWYAYDWLNSFLDNFSNDADITDANTLSDENIETATEVEEKACGVTAHPDTSSSHLQMWDNKSILLLIDLYKSYPVLWDVKYHGNCSREEKENAWQEISSTFGCNVNQVKEKIIRLTGSYRREKSKQKRSSESENITKYVSRWFAFDRLNFLPDKTDSAEAVDKHVEDNTSTTNASENFIEMNDKDPKETKRRKRERDPPKSPSQRLREFRARQKALKNANKLDSLNTTQVEDNTSTTNASEYFIAMNERDPTETKRRKRERDPKLDEFLKMAMKSDKDLDYHFTFGQLIASELRKYDEETLACVKHAINNIIFETDLKMSNAPHLNAENEEQDCTVEIQVTPSIFPASSSIVKTEQCENLSEMHLDEINFGKSTLKKHKREDHLLDELIDILKKNESSSDYYISFGQHVANELRKYDQKTLACVKHSINDVIFRADLGRIDVDSYSSFIGK